MILWLLSALQQASAITIIAMIVAFFVSSAVTLGAGKMLKVEHATFRRALLATLLGLLAGAATDYLLLFLLQGLLIIGIIFSTIGGWLIDSLVVKAILATSYGKGLLIALLASVPVPLIVVAEVLILQQLQF